MAKVSVGTIESRWIATPEENAIIHKATSCFMESARFNLAFQNKQWDGVLRMFNPKSGILPSGLVPDAIEALEACGYPVDITSHAPDAPPRVGGEIYFELDDDHQMSTVEALASTNRGIFHGATNAGKTKIAEAWCALNDLKTIFLVPSQELLNQTVASFKRDTNLDVGHISAKDDWVIGKDVTVCLVTSVAKRKSRKTGKLINAKAVEDFAKIAPLFQAVIVDECHHLVAPTWQSVMHSLRNAHFRFGLSGTPWATREDQLQVMAHLGPVLKVVTNKELIEKGWSAKPLIHMVKYSCPKSAIKVEDYDDLEAFGLIYQKEIVENSPRNTMIQKFCEKLFGLKKSCLVLANRVEHCYELGSLLAESNIPHHVITGQRTKSEDRVQFLTDFKEGKTPILISNVVNEGIDIPSLNALIFAGGGKSSQQIVQRVGRGIRKKPEGENTVQIFDFMDESSEMLRGHSMMRVRLYKQEGFQVEHTEI